MILEAVFTGLLGLLAEQQADSDKTTYSYVTQGKQAVRKEYSKTEPSGRPERAEVSSPDAYAYRSVGKQVERVTARDLAPAASAAPEAPSKDSYSYVTVGKRLERRAVTSDGK
jgi:hypothetical protein